MSKKNVELNVAFADGETTIKVVTVVLQGRDLYAVIHTPDLPFQAKHSYHESGVVHTKAQILGHEMKAVGRKEKPLDELTGFELITSGGGPPPKVGDYVIKPDTQRRKTLLVAQPKSLWGAEVWAIERGRDALVKKIAETPPYKEVSVSSLLADWSSPCILVKVWQALGDSPYEVIRYDPPVPGHVPYILDPPSYRGTWLDEHFRSRPAFEQGIVEQFRRERS